MKIQVISGVLFVQLVLCALALVAVCTKATSSFAAIALLAICYGSGLVLVVCYSIFWKENGKAKTVNEDKGRVELENRSTENQLIQTKRKVAELHTEMENARREIWELSRFKSDFLAHISHEIRTPLNAVVGMAELLGRTPLTTDQQELVSLMNSSGETLLSVINDILNYSRIEAGEFALEYTEFDLSDLVEGTTQLLVEQGRLKEVALTTFVSPSLAHSYIGDPGRLKQILLNLLGNAVRFAQPGEIVTSAEEDPQNKDFIRFSVKDNSSAMTSSIVGGLFTPMTEVDMTTARKYGGAGLGLSVSKKLVELMRGEMGVENTLEGGTLYWFSAALREAPMPETTAADSMLPLRKNIMLYGKASGALAVVMAYCKSWGLQSEYQPSAGSALEELRRSPDAYDMMILDPDKSEESVEDFLQEFGADDDLSGVHLLVLTSDEETEQRIRKLGYSLQILRKPFKRAHLRECMRQAHMRLRRTGDVERSESHIKSVVASVGFSNNPAKHQAEQQDAAAADREGEKILIVEDNPVNRRLVHLQLRTLGLDCDIVENGQEALDALRQCQYDLVLMDCWMPIMDGFAATEKIRQLDQKRGRHTTIVAMTANAMETDRTECLSRGMDDYISKPVTRAVLEEILNRWLPKRKELKFDTSEEKKPSDEATPTKQRLNSNTWS